MAREHIPLNSATDSAMEPSSLPFDVLECRVYRGPHLYSHIPMIRIQADLGELEEWPTNRLQGFTEKLLALLPSLHQHTCSTGKTGGFVKRLQDGTWLGHVIEHVAIELQSLAGMPVTRGKTRSVKGRRGCYNIMYHYVSEEVGLYAGRMALDVVASLLEPRFACFRNADKVYAPRANAAFDFADAMAGLKYLVNMEKLGPTTQALVDEAERRNIPWRKLDDRSLVQFGTGRYQKVVRASITSVTSSIGVETASDKELTKKLLADAGIPVPEGAVVSTLADAIRTAEVLGFPLVIKPLNANHGRGVSTDLRAAEDIQPAFSHAQEYSRHVIIEKYYAGRDYRVLVVNGDVVAVAERVPAHVVGNGINTIAELIEQVNADPRRGDGHENVMTRIVVNDTLISHLARANFTLESVPSLNLSVVLSPTANLSTGGSAIDRTDEIHADNASIARRAALVVGLNVAGIDMILPDISHSWREAGGGIVEVNASPGFRMHLHPSAGCPRDVAKPVMAALFPLGQKTRVPVVAVTGSNGKSTTVRMVAHILRQSGLRVGFTSTSGIFVNDECIWKGDASGPKSARMLMRDPTIDVAVIETARGGILREGFGVADCDVGAVLNVTGDHLGISGVETIEDLAAVKSVVAETVHYDGVSVLNADDPHTLAMARHAGGSVCYFSMNENSVNNGSAPLHHHISKGGSAVVCETITGKNYIILHRDNERIPVIRVNDIPATYNGVAVFNVENALAATAIATALGVDAQTIRTALAGFTSSFSQNPGRFNIYDGHPFRVVMDYAHNPPALSAFFAMIEEMRSRYARVIGAVSVPGDRRCEDIREVGRIAGQHLDIAFFPEKPDRRGRAPGEIHALLMEGVRSVGGTDERTSCVLHEEDATLGCLQAAQAGDLVVVMASDPETTWQQIVTFKPENVQPHEQRMAGGKFTYG